MIKGGGHPLNRRREREGRAKPKREAGPGTREVIVGERVDGVAGEGGS